jgi:hypothetical protein
LFISETSTNATNVLSAFGKFNSVGFSPFFIERSAAPGTELTVAYGLISHLAPARRRQHRKGSPVTAILIAAGPDEFYFGVVGGAIRIAFAPTTPGPRIAGLGDAQQGRFVEGQWRVVRQLGGDDTGQGEILTVRPNAALRVTVYRYE